MFVFSSFDVKQHFAPRNTSELALAGRCTLGVLLRRILAVCGERSLPHTPVLLSSVRRQRDEEQNAAMTSCDGYNNCLLHSPSGDTIEERTGELRWPKRETFYRFRRVWDRNPLP